MRPLAPWLAATALLTGACSASPPWVAPEEHQRLARQLRELERRAAQAEQEIERLRDRVRELETGSPRPVAPTSPPPAARPAATAAPLEGNAVEPGWRSSRTAIEEADLGGEPEPSPGPGAERTSDYQSGLLLLRDGRPADAETAFARFLAAEPDSDLADNAWFWIGESRLSRGDMAGAISAYRDCLERHPHGNKAPDAMLKLGHALEITGELAAAREVWSELVRQFPATAAAESARRRLPAP